MVQSEESSAGLADAGPGLADNHARTFAGESRKRIVNSREKADPAVAMFRSVAVVGISEIRAHSRAVAIAASRLSGRLEAKKIVLTTKAKTPATPIGTRQP